MDNCLKRLPQGLIDEKGTGFVAFWNDCTDTIYYEGTVGEFLSNPDNQGVTWKIDGGWGGPPGPIRVDWSERLGQWINRGFPPWSNKSVDNYFLNYPKAGVLGLTYTRGVLY